MTTSAAQSLILLRIRHWEDFYIELANRYGAVENADFAFLADETRAPIDTAGFGKIAFSAAQAGATGLIIEAQQVHGAVYEDPLWYNTDYSLYAAYLARPQYQYFWILDENLLLNFENYDHFFSRFTRESTDFLATLIYRPAESWLWYDATARFFPQVWSAPASITRLSNRALAYALAQRLSAAQAYRSAGHGELIWPFGEAWLASLLSNHQQFSVADLNDSMFCYDHGGGSYASAPHRRRDLLSGADDLIYYPVFDDGEYLQRSFHWHIVAKPEAPQVSEFLDIAARCCDVPANRTRCQALAAFAGSLGQPSEPLSLTRRRLTTTRCWLGQSDGVTLADAVRLRHDGAVEGAAVAGVTHWVLHDGELRLEAGGVSRLVFRDCCRPADGGLILRDRPPEAEPIGYVLALDLPAMAEPRPVAVVRPKPSPPRPPPSNLAASAPRSRANGELREINVEPLLAELAALEHCLDAMPAPVLRAGPMPGPLVSIVLPVYNQSDLVEAAIDSVLAQTYRHWELIIVDDGSTDDVTERVRNYAGDRRILFLHQPNLKLPAALNSGFAQARGELLSWTSADNLLLSTQIERLVEALRRHPNAGLAYSDYWVIDAAGEPLADPSWRPHNRDPEIDGLIRLPDRVTIENFQLTSDNFIGASFMYRRGVAELIGRYADDTFGGEDYDFWLRLHLATEFCHVREPLYKYRVHDNTLTARAGTLDLFANFPEIREMARWRSETLVADGLRCGDGVLRPAEQFHGELLRQCKPVKLSEFAGAAEPEIGLPLVVDVDVPERQIDTAVLRRADILLCRSDLACRLLKQEFAGERQRVLRWSGALGAAEYHAFVQAVAEKAGDPEGRPAGRPSPAIDDEFRPRRIVLIVDRWSSGGLENVVADLAAQLAGEGCAVFLAAALDAVPPPVGFEPDGAVHTLAFDGDVDRFTAFLRAETIDVVNYHYSFFAADEARELGVATVYTMHNCYVWMSDDDRREVAAKLARMHGVITVSRQVAQFAAAQFACPAGRITVIPNGLPDAIQPPAERPPHRAGMRLRVMIVGSFLPLKLHAVAVAAFFDAADDNPDLELHLAGAMRDDRCFAALEAQIAGSPHRDRVTISAGLGRNETIAALQESEIFMLPSAVEGWSLALMEAIAAGCVCIASDVGGARDLCCANGGVVLIPSPLGELDDVGSTKVLEAIAADLPEHRAHIAATLHTVASDYPAFAARVAHSQARLSQLCDMRQMADAYLRAFAMAYRRPGV